MKPIKHLLKKVKRCVPIANLYANYLARGQAKRGFSNQTEPLILIYQMGKVGSTSVYQSIKNCLGDDRLFHIHFLSDDIKNHIKTHKQNGQKNIPFHLKLGKYLRNELKNHPEKQVKIVSLVREPIAWFISVLFEPPYFEKEILNVDNSIDSTLANNYIIKRLQDKNSFHYLSNWFDREIKQVFNIDVFEEPFTKELGYKFYRNKNVELLVIRLEDLDRIGASSIATFLDLSNEFKLEKDNVRMDKKDAKVYLNLIESLTIDKGLCKDFYTIPFANHFYTSEQINMFIKKWSKVKDYSD